MTCKTVLYRRNLQNDAFASNYQCNGHCIGKRSNRVYFWGRCCLWRSIQVSKRRLMLITEWSLLIKIGTTNYFDAKNDFLKYLDAQSVCKISMAKIVFLILRFANKVLLVSEQGWLMPVPQLLQKSNLVTIYFRRLIRYI